MSRGKKKVQVHVQSEVASKEETGVAQTAPVSSKGSKEFLVRGYVLRKFKGPASSTLKTVAVPFNQSVCVGGKTYSSNEVFKADENHPDVQYMLQEGLIELKGAKQTPVVPKIQGAKGFSDVKLATSFDYLKDSKVYGEV